MNLLVVNLHSSQNAGDHALTLETIRQARRAFERPRLTLAMNDPEAHHRAPDVEVVGGFSTWLRGPRAAWKLPYFFLASLLFALLWRLAGRDPGLGLAPEQQRLLRAYAEADAVMSCAGNVFYSSGRFGTSLLLSTWTLLYARLLGRPIFTLPQSIGPLRARWEERLVGWLLRRMTLVLAREPRSWATLERIGAPLDRCRLVPDIAFAFDGGEPARARALLARYVGESPGPLLGITVINWSAQNRRFQQQGGYQAAVEAAIARFLAETAGQVVLFAQVWGPTASEDDRIPARAIARRFEGSGRVHFVDEPLGPALLKSCYGQMELFLGTRLHSNIFALAEGRPVLAVGYLSKTRGVMEMLGMEEWMLEIGEATEETLPERLMAAWEAREALAARVARELPAIQQAASEALSHIAATLPRPAPALRAIRE